MVYKPSMKLELNNSRFRHWNSVTIKQELNALSNITIGLPNPAGVYTNKSIEDMPIKFYLGWDTDTPPLRFDGLHDDPSWKVGKASLDMSLTGRDFGRSLFDELTVDSNFESYGNPLGQAYIIDFVKYLINNLAEPLPQLFSRANDDVDTFQYEFSHNKILQDVKTLCAYGGYEWFMTTNQSGTRNMVVRPPRSLTVENVTHAFVVGDESRYGDIPTEAAIHHVSGISVIKNYGFKKNYVKVIGDEVQGVYPLSPPEKPKHLYHEDDSIVSSGDAQAVAQRLWNEKSAPKTLVDFGGVGVEQLRVGDIIYVNDLRYGASELPSNIFRLINITDTITKGGGWNATYKVADFVPSMFQFFNNTTGL